MTEKLQLEVHDWDADPSMKYSPTVTNRSYRIASADSKEFIPYEWYSFVESRIYDWETLGVVVANAWYSGFGICVSYHRISEASTSRLDSVITQLLAECTGIELENIELVVEDRAR